MFYHMFAQATVVSSGVSSDLPKTHAVRQTKILVLFRRYFWEIIRCWKLLCFGIWHGIILYTGPLILEERGTSIFIVKMEPVHSSERLVFLPDYTTWRFRTSKSSSSPTWEIQSLQYFDSIETTECFSIDLYSGYFQSYFERFTSQPTRGIS